MQKSELTFKLIIGISKPLLKDLSLSSELKENSSLSQISFTFREVVSVEKVLDVLKKFE